VPEALRFISGQESYDVLLSDLHMPGAGDGLTVVSAMRHASRAGYQKARLLQRRRQSHAHNFIIVDEKYPNMVHFVSLIGTIGGYSSML
jgi:CheY-like chemotaxis protein